MEKEYLEKLLDYNEDSGIFTWKVSVKGTKGKGKEAGTLTNKGYKDVCIKGKKYGLHRLAFLLKKGYIPKCVDHVNGVKSDNRWVNLREASYSQNGYNYEGTGSKTGYKNVYYDPRGRKNYFVAITTNKKRKTYGYYYTVKEADEVACELRKLLHGEFSCNTVRNEIDL